MTRDEIVEVMARELTGFLGSNCCHRSGGQPGPNRRSDCDCVIAASAALAALEARGMVVVPAEPTEAMKAAGWIDKEDVNPADIYCAMLAARPEQE